MIQQPNSSHKAPLMPHVKIEGVANTMQFPEDMPLVDIGTFLNKFLKVGEPLATIATGAIAEPIAGVAGIVQAVNPFAEKGAGAEAVEGVRSALTFEPRSEAGKEGLQAVGDVLSPIGEALGEVELGLGEKVLELTGSPELATIAHTLPTAVLEALGVKGLKSIKKSGELNEQLAKQTRTKELQESVRVRGGIGILDEPNRSNQKFSRAENGNLVGLPEDIPGFQPGHSKPINDIAKNYVESLGDNYTPPNLYAPIDLERSTSIANLYDEMPHTPDDPVVISAYNAMIEEVTEQYQAAIDGGLEVEFIDFDKMGDPYEGSPRKAIEDITENNHMFVFSTRDGFGSDASFDPKDNPMLNETNFKISGQPALANDLFRVVHDYFGHAKEGVGFRAAGEENAWRNHSAMFSKEARRALTTETRGQNSWVNFGPFGETNRTASGAETVFADQKIGLLPEWVSESFDDVSATSANVEGAASARANTERTGRLPVSGASQ